MRAAIDHGCLAADLAAGILASKVMAILCHDLEVGVWLLSGLASVRVAWLSTDSWEAT
jgi:hypothetical protein